MQFVIAVWAFILIYHFPWIILLPIIIPIIFLIGTAIFGILGAIFGPSSSSEDGDEFGCDDYDSVHTHSDGCHGHSDGCGSCGGHH